MSAAEKQQRRERHLRVIGHEEQLQEVLEGQLQGSRQETARLLEMKQSSISRARAALSELNATCSSNVAPTNVLQATGANRLGHATSTGASAQRPIKIEGDESETLGDAEKDVESAHTHCQGRISSAVKQLDTPTEAKEAASIPNNHTEEKLATSISTDAVEADPSASEARRSTRQRQISEEDLLTLPTSGVPTTRRRPAPKVTTPKNAKDGARRPKVEAARDTQPAKRVMKPRTQPRRGKGPWFSIYRKGDEQTGKLVSGKRFTNDAATAQATMIEMANQAMEDSRGEGYEDLSLNEQLGENELPHVTLIGRMVAVDHYFWYSVEWWVEVEGPEP